VLHYAIVWVKTDVRGLFLENHRGRRLLPFVGRVSMVSLSLHAGGDKRLAVVPVWGPSGGRRRRILDPSTVVERLENSAMNDSHQTIIIQVNSRVGGVAAWKDYRESKRVRVRRRKLLPR